MKIFEVKDEESQWVYEVKPNLTNDEVIKLLGIIKKAKHQLINSLDK